jgi:hypothetical protein
MTFDVIATGSTGNAVVVNAEIWKDIPGWEGVYQISNMGRIKSFKQTSNGKILSLVNRNGDYFSVVLQRVGKKRQSVRVHRLVAEAFIPNPDNLPEVNHIDGNKQNNRAENLEWCSRSHNVIHSIGMHPEQLRGMIFYNKSIRPRSVVQISKKSGEVLASFPTAIAAYNKTGICARNILQVANRTPFNEKGQIRKTAGGYIWRFEREVMQK